MDPSWDWIGYEHWKPPINVESPWVPTVVHHQSACYCHWSHLPSPGFEDLPQNYHRWLLHGGINHIKHISTALLFDRFLLTQKPH